MSFKSILLYIPFIIYTIYHNFSFYIIIYHIHYECNQIMKLYLYVEHPELKNILYLILNNNYFLKK